MAVEIGRAIQDGANRTFARNGLLLAVAFFVLGTISTLLSNTVTRATFDPGQMPGVPGVPGMGADVVGPGLGISPIAASALSLVLSLVSLLVVAAALRTFVTEDTERIPGERFTHNWLWMLVNLIVGGIVFGIAVAIGVVLLILPGLFLLVSLFFWNLYVVVEDQNFIEGFQNSWALTRGNRLMLFVLGVVVVIIGWIVSAIFGIPGIFLPPIVGLLVSQVGSALVTVFVLATAARTFEQLRASEAVDDTAAE